MKRFMMDWNAVWVFLAMISVCSNSVLYSYHNLRMSITYSIWSHHNTSCLFAPLFALMDLSVNSNSNHDPSQYDHSCRREMFYFSYIHKGQNILNANISRNVGWIKRSIMPRCNSSICICLHTWVCFRPRYLSLHYTLCWNVNNAMKLVLGPASTFY